jgi:aubergine
MQVILILLNFYLIFCKHILIDYNNYVI